MKRRKTERNASFITLKCIRGQCHLTRLKSHFHPEKLVSITKCNTVLLNNNLLLKQKMSFFRIVNFLSFPISASKWSGNVSCCCKGKFLQIKTIFFFILMVNDKYWIIFINFLFFAIHVMTFNDRLRLPINPSCFSCMEIKFLAKPTISNAHIYKVTQLSNLIYQSGTVWLWCRRSFSIFLTENEKNNC